MSHQRSPEELDLMWSLLYADFETSTNIDATDEELANELLALILWRERIRHGVEGTVSLWPKVDELTLSAMNCWDTNRYELLASEKIFKLLANKENLKAVQLLKSAVNNKLSALRKQLSDIAKKPRSTRHPLTILVESIVRDNPNIATAELKKKIFKELRESKEHNLTCDFHNSCFIPHFDIENKKLFRVVPIANLHKYLERAKKKFLAKG